jgi:predicted metal-dependent hydrolase
MDSTILYEKDGMKFSKIHDKKYTLDFSMENKNILLANVVNFDLIKLIYELNGDIYESVNIEKISDNEATVVLVMKHLFEDLGLPQRYSYLHMTKIVNNNEIIFRSQSIYSERPKNIPKDSELMAMKENIGTCKIISPHKISFSFAVVFEDYVKIPQFAEKMIGIILNKIFKRVKQIIENITFN